MVRWFSGELSLSAQASSFEYFSKLTAGSWIHEGNTNAVGHDFGTFFQIESEQLISLDSP